MHLLLVIFGLSSGCILSVLVGFVGRERNIGFGWAFLLSLIFTPLVGLILTLLSSPNSRGGGSWGCLGSIMGTITAMVCVVIIFLILIVLGL